MPELRRAGILPEAAALRLLTVFGRLLWWYARYVIVVLSLGLILIAVTWLGQMVLDRLRLKRRK